MKHPSLDNISLPLTAADVNRAMAAMDQEGINPEHTGKKWAVKQGSHYYPVKHLIDKAMAATGTAMASRQNISDKALRSFLVKLGFHVLVFNPTGPAHRFWLVTGNPPLKGRRPASATWHLEGTFTERQRETIELKKGLFKPGDRVATWHGDVVRLAITGMGTVKKVAKGTLTELVIIWDANAPFIVLEQPPGISSQHLELPFMELTDEALVAAIFNEPIRPLYVIRLSFNALVWRQPSGPRGKSTSKGQYEAKFGYNPDEWLLDPSKHIHGKQYGFLEPLRHIPERYYGTHFHARLFTFDRGRQRWYRVGDITKVQIIDGGEANAVREIYQQRGWLQQMDVQTRQATDGTQGLQAGEGLDLVNMSFDWQHVHLCDPMVELKPPHPIAQYPRYRLYPYGPHLEARGGTIPPFTFQEPTTAHLTDFHWRSQRGAPYRRKAKLVQNRALHWQIQTRLLALLQDMKGIDHVYPEHPTGYAGGFIDLVVREQTQFIFYEIKTYKILRTCVQEALGQLLEYHGYPYHQRAAMLVIVSHLAVDQYTLQYMAHLREQMGLPVYYQHFDIATSQLSQLY